MKSANLKTNTKRFVHAGMTGGIGLSLISGILAIFLGLIGWSIAIYDGSFRSIVDIFTRTVGSFIPSSQGSSIGNWATQSGTLFANIATVSGGILIALTNAREALTRWRSRLFWKGHIIIIGDTKLARLIAEGFDNRGERVLHIVPITAAKTLPVGPIRVRSDAAGTDIQSFGLSSARIIVIDSGADGANLNLTGAALAALKLERRANNPVALTRHPSISVNVVDAVFSDRFASRLLEIAPQDRDVGIASRPTFFDINKVTARNTLARYPLFRLAYEKKQRRVHALIIGFGRLGEHLMDQVMLTSLAGDLLAPCVTIVDRVGSQREKEFRARRPVVADSLDIQFVDFDFECQSLDQSAPSQTLLSKLKRDDLTAIFVVLPSDEDVLRTTLLIDELRGEHPAFDATLFYRSRLADDDHDVLGNLLSAPDELGKFIRMRSPLHDILREISDPDGREKLAEALHRSYLTSSDLSALGRTSWELLPESLRRANVRAADHLPAKLWTLGLNPETTGEGRKPGDIEKLRNVIDRLKSDPISFHHVAELEHGRWMIERKLDGWVWSGLRDDARRHHPSLVEWSELKLSDSEVEKDVRQIATKLQFALESLQKAKHHRS